MSFDEVVGHDDAREGFRRAFERGRIAHAYLLAGPRGIGKGLLARQVATALLCPQSGIGTTTGADIAPCGDCGACRAVVSGNHQGFLLLTPGEGRGIDVGQIRDLVRFLSLRSEERRVVLLEPAERLAEPAANALLKILEEPAAGTVFLLVSHRPAQLLSTIVSRCQRVMMGPLNGDSFVSVLAQHGIGGDEAFWFYQATGGRPGAALALSAAIDRCGGQDRFRQLITSPPADPRDLVVIADLSEESPKADREAVLTTLNILSDGVWAYRPEDPAGRSVAAERASLLAQVARHVEWAGSPDLGLEAASLILSASDPTELHRRLPRSLGVA